MRTVACALAVMLLAAAFQDQEGMESKQQERKPDVRFVPTPHDVVLTMRCEDDQERVIYLWKALLRKEAKKEEQN